MSRASKKSGQYEHLAVPRTLLQEQITLGRGEFGDVLLAKIDLGQVKKLRDNDDAPAETKLRPTQLAEFRRQLDMFGRVRHRNVARLLGLCSDAAPHCMLLEHTDWGDLKNFLIATRSPEETAEYIARIGGAHPVPPCSRTLPPLNPQHRVLLATHLAAAASALAAKRITHRTLPPLNPQHRVLLATHLAAAASALAAKRITHRDIAARNCIVTSQLQLKLSHAALSRGPDSYEYYKLHDQVIPLRWLPAEALEGEYSMKSDVYMFAATVWEIYTKAELPFAKLNDNSVLEKLKSGTLVWSTPALMPPALQQLLKRCWSNSPAERPSFTEITEQMTAILQDITSDNKSTKSQEKQEE
ncbi:protein tyrosine kinase domain-containing protein [Phthorimaea operculella]|nr:protein tyrosine kinase domain-containing protein [Phthorimaea operculella]